MTVEEVYEIMENDCEITYDDLADDEVLEGLKILEKYIDSRVIQGADHDIIYSEDIDVLIQNGLSKEDVIQLSRLGWHIDEGDCFAHFV